MVHEYKKKKNTCAKHPARAESLLLKMQLTTFAQQWKQQEQWTQNDISHSSLL